MKPNLHNPYGYKVCYRERRSKRIVRYFIVHSYKDAVSVKQGYIRYDMAHSPHHEEGSLARYLAGVSFLGLSRSFFIQKLHLEEKSYAEIKSHNKE